MIRLALRPLRKRGYLICNYLDDFLVVGTDLQKTLSFLETLGMVFSPSKTLTNVHRVKSLGFILDSKKLTIEVPEQKFIDITSERNTISNVNLMEYLLKGKIISLSYLIFFLHIYHLIHLFLFLFYFHSLDSNSKTENRSEIIKMV